MDTLSKVLVFLTLAYILYGQTNNRIITAAAAYDDDLQEEEKVVEEEMIAIDAGVRPNELKLNRDFQQQQQNQNNHLKDLDDKYWRELEAQIFLFDLFNLTKSNLLLLNGDTNLDEECLRLNKSIVNTELVIKELIVETSNSANHYEKHKAEANYNSVKIPLFKLDSILNNRKNDNKHEQAFKELVDCVGAYFACIRATRKSDSTEKMIKSLLPLSGYMLKLAESMESSLKEHDLSFSQLVPVNTDIILDSLKYEQEKKNDSSLFDGSLNLLDNLILSFKRINYKVKEIYHNTKDYFGL